MAPMTMRNPITGVEEPYFPKRNQIHRILAGSMVIIMMVRVWWVLCRAQWLDVCLGLLSAAWFASGCSHSSVISASRMEFPYSQECPQG